MFMAPMAMAGVGGQGNGQFAPNAGMHVGRIDIEGQLGVCDRGGVKVSRAQPAILSGLVTDEQWNSFCDRIDVTLEPMQKVKDLNLYFLGISAILIIVLFIGGMVIIADMANWDTSREDNSFWIFMLVATGFLIVGGFGLQAYSRERTFAVRSALQRVCDDVSADHPDVSFHVKFEAFTFFRGRDANTRVLNYIEVSINRTGMEAEKGPAVVVNVNNTGAGGAMTAEVPTAVPAEKAEAEETAPPPATATATTVVKGTAVTNDTDDNIKEAEEEEIEVKADLTDAEDEKTETNTDDIDEEQPPQPPSEQRTAAERLAELETLKDLLTEEEYAEKKREILATI